MLYPPNEWQWKDSAGAVLPWFTRPFLDVLEQWKKMVQGDQLRDWRVFEWGAGYSTIWWARNCYSVSSIEADDAWSKAVLAELCRDPVTQSRIARGVTLGVHTIADDDPIYPFSVKTTPEFGKYDCIVIDGSNRLECAREAVNHVKPGGIIILDNSDENPGVFDVLKHNEHHTYPQPGHPHWCTTYWLMTKFGSPPESPEVAAHQQKVRRGMA